MFFTYGTDAPIYYFPWMTIVIVVMNVLVFIHTGSGIDDDGWLLTYGGHLRPWEWVGYNFLHLSPMHLIGNMFFLWSFGIVVEGKLGWYRFLMLYLGIGVAGGAIIQTATILNSYGGAIQVEVADSTENPNASSDENAPRQPLILTIQPRGAGGASLAISGLMAIVFIWAPRNDVLCFWFWFIYYIVVGTFRVQYLYFCGLFIALDLSASGVFSGRMGFGTASGHAVGALIGLVTAVAFLRLNWVDCEDWDLFNAFKERRSSVDEVGKWR